MDVDAEGGGGAGVAGDPHADNVTITANSPLTTTGSVSGLDSPGNVLSKTADFISGVADLTALGMTYTGTATAGTFHAASGSGKTGIEGLAQRAGKLSSCCMGF